MSLIIKIIDFIYRKILGFFMSFWWDEGLAGVIIFWAKTHDGISRYNFVDSLVSNFGYSKKLVEKHLDVLVGSFLYQSGSGIYIDDAGEDYVDNFIESVPDPFVYGGDGDKQYIVDYNTAYFYDINVYRDFNGYYEDYKEYRENVDNILNDVDFEDDGSDNKSVLWEDDIC